MDESGVGTYMHRPRHLGPNVTLRSEARVNHGRYLEFNCQSYSDVYVAIYSSLQMSFGYNSCRNIDEFLKKR